MDEQGLFVFVNNFWRFLKRISFVSVFMQSMRFWSERGFFSGDDGARHARLSESRVHQRQESLLQNRCVLVWMGVCQSRVVEARASALSLHQNSGAAQSSLFVVFVDFFPQFVVVLFRPL
jgi:hypothetical protein